MRLLALRICATLLFVTTLAKPTKRHRLNVRVTVGDSILEGSTDGHIQLLFAPAGTQPLDDTDVTSSPNYFFGKNVFGINSGSSVLLAGGNDVDTDFGVWGFPNVSIDDVQPGAYAVQAFLNKYEKVTRADGSTINVNFPCGDGAPGIAGYGSVLTSVTHVTVTGKSQVIDLVLSDITLEEDFTGDEIGGCHQGNYEDTDIVKYLKIRSDVLSAWWGRDMYVGATVLLPQGYDASDPSRRYPVVYSQGHWPGGNAPFNRTSEDFLEVWKSGTIPATEGGPRDTPKLIAVAFRHENPFYDDSYAVNTANLGPWGDAINDELIPHIDATFNTIAEPYARVQEGGSTGGWESAASLVFRPDLFGVTFSYYPDSLDFHRHQAIPLYTNKNAYEFTNGGAIPSIRTHVNGTEVVLATAAQENHWELTFGTSSRSQIGQWDIWNAVFGAQGLNGYPLEPWDKVTGQIYTGAVEYWKHMDLANYITTNWDNDLNLGEVLKHRMFLSVGTWDTYYLNEPLMQFQSRIEAKGGSGWANFTYLQDKPHGGTYNLLNIWTYLDLLLTWVEDHAPNGKTPLSNSVTKSSSRGNIFEDVIAYGGHQAALARQAPPLIQKDVATVGRWDPGVVLEAQWIVDGRPCGRGFKVDPGAELTVPTGKRAHSLRIEVTGRKRGYAKETRKSNVVRVEVGAHSGNEWYHSSGFGSKSCRL